MINCLVCWITMRLITIEHDDDLGIDSMDLTIAMRRAYYRADGRYRHARMPSLLIRHQGSAATARS